MPDYVQGGAFGGLNFQPLDWGSPTGPTPPVDGTAVPGIVMNDPGPLQPLPAIQSSFAPSQTSQGNVVTSQGGSGAANPISLAAPTSIAPSNAQAGAQPSTASGIVSGSLADYFYRAVIIILGFIFVAIGLNMFKPGLVPVPGIPGRHR